MNEQLVAINKQSLYPEIREGNNRMSEVTVSRGEGESPKTRTTDGESRPGRSEVVESRREQKAESEKRKEAEANVRQVQTQRRQDLERVRREVEESTRQVAEEAKKVVKVIKQAAVEKGNLRPVVKSEKPLTELPYEEVVRSLKEAIVDIDVPRNWDDLKEWDRQELIAKAEVINEVEPVIEEIEIAGRKYFIWDKEKETSTVFGVSEHLSRSDAKALLKVFGKDTFVPFNFEKHSLSDRKLWMKNHGLTTVVDYKEQDDDFRLIDIDSLNLTSKQVKLVYGIEVPENWAALDKIGRAKIFLANKLIQTIGGGGFEVPEWNDHLPTGDPNPQSNSRQELKKVIERRQVLLNRGLDIVGPGHDWTELRSRMVSEVFRMTRVDYTNYSEIRSQFESILRIHKGVLSTADPILIADFDAIMPPVLRNRLKLKIDQMNSNFEAITTGMPPEAQKEFFRILKSKSAALLKSVKVGYYSDEYMRDQLIEMAQNDPLNNLRNREGILVWYILEKQLPHVSDILSEIRELEDVIDPDELEERVMLGLEKAESTSLSSQDLNNYYSRVLGLLQDSPRFKSQEFNETVTRLYAQINASLLRSKLFLASQSEEGMPEAMLGIYKEIQNELVTHGRNTNQLYLERFRMVLSDGRPIKGKDGAPIINPATGEAFDFNLLSDYLNLDYNQVQNEKLMFLEIEAAQREGRPLNIAIFEANGVPPPLNLTKDAIDSWRKIHTFIGATNDPVINAAGNRARTPDGREISYFERQMIKNLARYKKFLREFRGLTPEQIKKLEFKLQAVQLNAYRWLRSEAGSEFDGIDIYGTDGKPIDTIFGDKTPYRERTVDNLFKHYRNESRGRKSQTNRILEESMPMGYWLPTVRVGVRYAGMMFYNDPTSSPELFNLTGFNTRHGFALPLGTTIYQAVEALTAKLQEDFKTSKDHAEGVALADLLDHGNIRLGFMPDNPAELGKMIDWEENLKDASRFNMLDVSGDRQAAIKMDELVQTYLKNPTWDNFLKVWSQNFYSGRNLRIWPNFKEALKAHHRILQKQKGWFKREDSGSAFDTYQNIRASTEAGLVDPDQAEPIMRELLGIGPIPGIGPVRYARFWAEFGDKVARTWVKNIPGGILSAFFEFLGGIFKQSAHQLGAAR